MKTLLIQLWTDPERFRKFYMALAGAVLAVVGVATFPEPYDTYVTAFLTSLTAGAVYAVPNKKEEEL